MGEFFKPWRRKVGVLTLMMAFVCIYGLIRSSHITDQLEIAVGDSIHFFTSSNGYFRWTRHAERPIGAASPVWYTIEYGSPGQPLDHEDRIDWKRRSDWYLFDFGNGLFRRSSLSVWTFSYLIGIPLTGIAATLLILTPRQSTPTKFIEPTRKEEATS